MKTKTVKIALEGFGSYLGMEKGCFIVKNDSGEVVSPGASSGALWCCFFLFFSYVFSDGVEV
jgi:hypothetical protein